MILRQRLEVSGAILAGGAVHVAAIIQDQHEVLAFADVFRALKHHVLEQVRESGAAGALVAAANVVRNVNRVDGRAVVGHKNYAQTVVEFRISQIELRAHLLWRL